MSRWAGMLVVVLALAGCGGSGGGDSAGNGSAGTGSAGVSGLVRYADRIYSASGFTGQIELKPVRRAEVELLDGQGQVVRRGYTDTAGAYSLNGVAAGSYRVRVLASAEGGFDPAPAVANSAGAVYAAVADVVLGDASGRLDLDIDDTAGVAGAFNIYDVMLAGSEYLASIGSSELGTLRAFWDAGSSRYGTYTCEAADDGSRCPQGRGVYLLGGVPGSDDTDEYDDDIVLHEFTHAVEFALGVHDSPGGLHQFTDSELDLRLAWSEGLAHYLLVGVKRWLLANQPARLSIDSAALAQTYIDTAGSVAFGFDLVTPDLSLCGSGDCYVYASNEVAVLQSLIGLLDRYGHAPVWNVVDGYLNTVAAAGRPSSLETFWDGWLALGAGASQADAEVLLDRLVRYTEDAAEPIGADSPLDPALTPIDCAVAGLCLQTEVRTLYRDDGVADLDYYPIQVRGGLTYEIRTLALSNGADTQLALFATDAPATPVAANDNQLSLGCASASGGRLGTANTGTAYASRLEYAAARDATLVVAVSTSAALCEGAGRYGSYRLSVAVSDTN